MAFYRSESPIPEYLVREEIMIIGTGKRYYTPYRPVSRNPKMDNLIDNMIESSKLSKILPVFSNDVKATSEKPEIVEKSEKKSFADVIATPVAKKNTTVEKTVETTVETNDEVEVEKLNETTVETKNENENESSDTVEEKTEKIVTLFGRVQHLEGHIVLRIQRGKTFYFINVKCEEIVHGDDVKVSHLEDPSWDMSYNDGDKYSLMSDESVKSMEKIERLTAKVTRTGKHFCWCDAENGESYKIYSQNFAFYPGMKKEDQFNRLDVANKISFIIWNGYPREVVQINN